jgi:hypothetical protein
LNGTIAVLILAHDGYSGDHASGVLRGFLSRNALKVRWIGCSGSTFAISGASSSAASIGLNKKTPPASEGQDFARLAIPRGGMDIAIMASCGGRFMSPSRFLDGTFRARADAIKEKRRTA